LTVIWCVGWNENDRALIWIRLCLSKCGRWGLDCVYRTLGTLMESCWFEWPTLGQLGVLTSPPRQPVWRKGARIWESPGPTWPLVGGFAPGSCGSFHRSGSITAGNAKHVLRVTASPQKSFHQNTRSRGWTELAPVERRALRGRNPADDS
jgi:hypothetical protein